MLLYARYEIIKFLRDYYFVIIFTAYPLFIYEHVYNDSFTYVAKAVTDAKSRIRELFLLELPPCECGLETEDGGPPADALGKAVNHLRDTCRENAIRISGVPIPTIIYD